MRSFKRCTSSLLAIMMLLCVFALPALAENESPDPSETDEQTTKVTIVENNATVTDKTFYGYQLMTAKTSDGDNGTMNAVYEVNDKYKTILQNVVMQLNTDQTKTWSETNPPSEDEIISFIGEITDRSDEMRTFADDIYKAIVDDNIEKDAVSVSGVFSDVPSGYWLIAATDASSLVMVDTKGHKELKVELKPADIPTIDKKVQENSTDNWQDYADYNIGDLVPFRIIGTLPKTEALGYFDTYKYVFTDTLSTGLTYDDVTADSDSKLKVYAVKYNIDGTEASRIEIKRSENGNDGYLFNQTGNVITVTFNNLKTVKDTEENDITIDGSYKILVEYKAVLSTSTVSTEGESNAAQITYSNDPYSTATGTSTSDEVKVFSYQLVINKTDGTNPLKGADFRLEKKNGDVYVPVDMSDGNTLDVKKVYYDANDAETTAADAVKFAFVGLDAGEYQLVETATPQGYNPIDSIQFKVEAQTEVNTSNTIVLKELTGTSTGNVAATFVNDTTNKAVLLTEVKNKSGHELPSTGGTGRTVLYVFGAVLMIGAVVLLVTKKRMEG